MIEHIKGFPAALNFIQPVLVELLEVLQPVFDVLMGLNDEGCKNLRLGLPFDAADSFQQFPILDDFEVVHVRLPVVEQVGVYLAGVALYGAGAEAIRKPEESHILLVGYELVEAAQHFREKSQAIFGVADPLQGPFLAAAKPLELLERPHSFQALLS